MITIIFTLDERMEHKTVPCFMIIFTTVTEPSITSIFPVLSCSVLLLMMHLSPGKGLIGFEAARHADG